MPVYSQQSPPPSTDGQPPPVAGARRGTYWRRRLVVGLIGFTVVALVIVGGAYGYVQWRFHQIHREHVAGLAALGGSGDQPINILLVGDNCRDCLDGSQASQFGTAADVAGGRADVTMLLRVDPGSGKVSLMSIPRDLWLPIPSSNSEIRVDAALNDGPSALVSTIEDDLNIPINHYVELNFDTFQAVVNALGGISMNFPTRLYDSYSTLNVPAGCFHLNGTQALQVVRARHTYYQQAGVWNYDGLGDISRIARDHEFLTVLASAVSAKGLSNPVTDNDLIGAVAKDLTIDSTFSVSDLAGLAQAFSHVNLGTAPQTTLPVDEDNSPAGYVYQGTQYGDVVFPTGAGDRAAIEAFLGQPIPGSAGSPGALPVAILNGSGISGQAAGTAAQLRALGFSVASTGTGTVNGSPAESVVYYAPGHESQAQRLVNELGGAVALGQDASIAGSGLTLVTGTNLTVASPPAGAGSPSAPGVPASAGASVPVATPIGGLTETSPAYPSFDPTACSAGQAAAPLPNLPVPNGNSLPSS
ncbi:MAG TPA: LCP family protein [Jatrophihabitantaceae bacterium]|jgi:LCP family protein required for cell wall assembly|nr:LCP family protein [Jatrophihabitantaceae bacterium]